MKASRVGLVAAALAAVAGGVSVSLASCGTTPPSVINHALQGSQRVDFACFHVNDANGLPIVPVPVDSGNCAPVAANVTATSLPYHLYALVTQPTLGALAIVDLTSGGVIDVNRSTPGVDFVPVGANPTDVAVSRDAQWTFVSSADLNRPAIYALNNGTALAVDGGLAGSGMGRSLLGNANGPGTGNPLALPDLRACALPQSPLGLALVPRSAGAGAADAGTAGDGGSSPSDYVLVAMLQGSSGQPAAVVTIDPLALTSATPGALASCTSLGAVMGGTVLGAEIPAASMAPAVPWPDGVPYADAAIAPPVPACAATTAGFDGGLVGPANDGGGGQDAGNEEAGGQDAASSGDDGGEDAATPDAGSAMVVTEGGAGDAGDAGMSGLPLGPPQPTAMAMRTDLPILYVADGALPVIHVIDLSDPTRPAELAPLVATSMVDPSRRVTASALAVSPPTRDYKTYLYAVDGSTIMVYDVTDPAGSSRTPLVRPHPELNPLAPPDRIPFATAISSVAFAQHDWPAPLPATVDPNHLMQLTGLLCNPNPQAHPDAGAFLDPGAYYRVDQAATIQSMDTQGGTVQSFPTRLRGVFAFVTLSTGVMVTVDVDDWDAPCRRPDPMSTGTVDDAYEISSADGGGPVTYPGGITGALDLPQPQAAPGDLDPYHAPLTYTGMYSESAAVTVEQFFPVSAPHRVRSSFLLRNDPVAGIHIPNLLGAPQLFNANGAPVATSATGSSPLLMPTPLPAGYVDPSAFANPADPNPSNRQPSAAVVLFPGAGAATSSVGVRLSFDDPTAHQDQDWTVTYEGALPTVNGISVDIDSTLPHSDPGAYESLTLSAPGARFCSRGIEDWSVGAARAKTTLGAMTAAFGGVEPGGINGQEASLASWTSDYVEIVDDPLPSTDGYWAETSSENDCWAGDLADSDGTLPPSPKAQARFNFCAQNYGSVSTPDTYLLRDLPIIHAHDDSLEVGRFGWTTTTQQTTSRVIVGADPGNVQFLKAIRCCFHHHATFKVRAGGEWVALGSTVGLLHQVVKENDAAGSCVLSCDPRMALMNARSFDVPWWGPPTSDNACPQPANVPQVDRNGPLAMRNPMFSFVMWSACTTPTSSVDHTMSTRDLTWKFSLRGGFQPQQVTLSSATAGVGVNPQAMRFIPALGQVAVVDSEAQGLVLVDLNLVAVAHNYF